MNPIEIIRRKRDGYNLSAREIKFFIDNFLKGKISDYQMSALLMAIYFQEMKEDETFHLTQTMLDSGKKIDLSKINAPKIDKHSSGGVGDKISLILAPLIASTGVIVPMISGRALGHTGGTLDKLEAIPGFKTNLTSSEFINQLEKIGVAIIGQTEEIAPADRKIYALRDVTATVENISLITASILSKKLAEGVEGIVFDVKVGNGAFMKTKKEAQKLANSLNQICQKMGVKSHSLLTDMNQPLGRAIGNALEVIEAIEVLKGNGPLDVLELSIKLGTEMLIMGRTVKNRIEGEKILKEKIVTGQALNKFKEIIETQGGNPKITEDYSLFPQSKFKKIIKAKESGYINEIDTLQIGLLGVELGAGRRKTSDSIDYSVGFIIHKKIGDWVEKGEPLLDIHYNKNNIDWIEKKLNEAFIISENPPEFLPLIIQRME
ncbi:MAG: thymidine phosphorylase [Candidatus Aminicenantia bacterium]